MRFSLITWRNLHENVKHRFWGATSWSSIVRNNSANRSHSKHFFRHFNYSNFTSLKWHCHCMCMCFDRWRVEKQNGRNLTQSNWKYSLANFFPRLIILEFFLSHFSKENRECDIVFLYNNNKNQDCCEIECKLFILFGCVLHQIDLCCLHWGVKNYCHLIEFNYCISLQRNHDKNGSNDNDCPSRRWITAGWDDDRRRTGEYKRIQLNTLKIVSVNMNFRILVREKCAGVSKPSQNAVSQIGTTLSASLLYWNWPIFIPVCICINK